jgi:ribosomal-protein-alanine N-acetyltransferase
MFFIESERLKMIPLTHQLLQLAHTNRPSMERELGLNISAMQIDELFINEAEDAMINFWLPKTLEHPEAYQWYTNWEIILKSTNTSIGGIGFAGEPNELGEAEIGYIIDKPHHNKGYATEALQLITAWVFLHETVNSIIVHTYEDNLPSRKILAKNGFIEIEKNEDKLMTYQLKKSL